MVQRDQRKVTLKLYINQVLCGRLRDAVESVPFLIVKILITMACI